MDFVAFDVETANADLTSICAIGLVDFENGEVLRRRQFLINPQDYFDHINVSIHGIDSDRVADAPVITDVLPELTATFAGAVVVHHTSFDRASICRIGDRHGIPDFKCSWLDSARVARRAWAEVARRGYGLVDLSERFGIDFVHHDASEDARAAGLIVLRAIADTGLSIVDWLIRASEPITATSGRERISLAGNRDGPLSGEIIAFTGALATPRREAAELAAAAGCTVAPGVTKKTTILIIGDQDVRVLNGYDKSAKHRKAEGLISEGVPLRIIGEADFRALVGLKSD
jgi:DNA polymerase III subunit epsilon